MNVMKYRKEDRDQIGNLMLLTAAENGPAEKTNVPPGEWFEGKPDEYLDLHLIPKDKDLWKIENFEKFLEERKNLIVTKFKYLLY